MPDFVQGEVVTAAKMNEIPKGVLGYAEITTSETGISTLEDVTGLETTVTVPANRMIRIEISVNIRQRTSPALAIVRIREGSTSLRRSDHQLAADDFATAQLSRILFPSPGQHTYKVSAQTSAGTVDVLADDNVTHGPAHILVTDLGEDPNA